MPTPDTEKQPTNKRSSILLLGSQMTVGGAQRVLLNLAGWLHHHSYPVTAAFFYDKDGLHQNWQQGAAFPIHDLQGWQAGGGLRGLLRLPGSLWRLFRLMRGGNCRAILTFTHHSNLLGIPMAWLAGVPIRIGTHRGRIESFPPWLERLHSIIINSTLCYCFLAVSEEIRNESMMEGIKKEKILVIPNAMEIPTVNSERITEFRHAFNLQSSDLCILSVGRLTIQKAHTYLLQAAKKVLLQFPQANVYIAGEGPLQDELETEVRTNDLLNNVHFLGVREDIFLLLAVTDIFVLSSRWEGMPNVLLEAMACGVPVVAFAVGGVMDVIRHKETGWLVTPGDVDGLAKAIITLLSDTTLRRRLGAAARQEIKQHYHPDQIYPCYEALLSGQELEQD